MTKYFFQIQNGMVAKAFQAERASWDGVEIPAGLTEVDEATFASTPVRSVANQDGTYAAPAASRVVSFNRLFDLLTPQEEVAIDLLASRTSGTLQEQQASAKIRVWLRRIQAAPGIPLDSPVVAAQLALLKGALVPTVWADSTVADARIARILSNQTPL
jgi:hypothetical protein